MGKAITTAKQRKVYAEDQPKRGDLVIHCAHVGEGSKDNGTRIHFHRLVDTRDGRGAEFIRPDGTVDRANWLVICGGCLIEHRANPVKAVAADSTWPQDDPVIEIDIQ